MTEDYPDLDIKTLQNAYVKRIATHIAEITQLREILETGYMPRSGFNMLYHLAHNFSGSGDTFGFPDISKTAHDLYYVLSKFNHNSFLKPTPSHNKNEVIHRLKLFEQACKAAAGTLPL